MMSYGDKVWKHLLRHGSITSKKIEKITGTVCPHDVIRKIRKKYGADTISDTWIFKTKTVFKNGKKYKVTERYKKYFLQLMGI